MERESSIIYFNFELISLHDPVIQVDYHSSLSLHRTTLTSEVVSVSLVLKYEHQIWMNTNRTTKIIYFVLSSFVTHWPLYSTKSWRIKLDINTGDWKDMELLFN